MLSVRFIIFILFTLGFKPLLFASDIGCLLSDSRIYTSKINPGLINVILGSTPIYESNQSIQLAPQCTSAPSSSCRVCHGSFSSLLGLITGCPVGFVYGSEVSYVLECPFDSYAIVLFLFSLGLGAHTISRKISIQ